MSIDREMALRENMFAGNPGALMQRYGMTQDTLDLLALMKVKKQQEAANRQLQASMQQQPGTVKEQAEQQVLQQARAQIAAPMMQRAQQATAAEQQKANRQRQAMQRMAAMAAQQGVGNPMMSGIARVPAPNMRMAEGGIVGYAQGDLIEGEEDLMMMTEALSGTPFEQRGLLAREIDRQIEELGGSQRGRIGSTRALPQEAQERIARVNELERDKLRLLAAGRDPEKIQATIDAVAGRMPYTTRPVGDFAERALPAGREGRSSEDIASMIATAMGQQAPQLKPTLERQDSGVQFQNVNAPATSTTPSGGFFSPSGPGAALAGGIAKGGASTVPAASTAPAASTTSASGLTGPLAGMPTVQADTDIFDDSAVKDATDRLRKAEKAVSGAYGAPKTERSQARKELDEYFGRAAKAAAAEADLAGLAALDRAQMTPDKLRRALRRQALLGASGKTRGFVGPGIMAGVTAEEQQQEAAARNRLLQQQAMRRAAEAQDIKIAEEGAKSGRTAEEQAALGLRGLLSAASEQRPAIIRAATETAKLKFEEDKLGQSAYIENAKLAQESAQDAIENASNNITLLQAERKNMKDQVDAIFASLIQGQDYQRAVNTLREGKPVIIGNLPINSEAELQMYYNQQALTLVDNSLGGSNEYGKTIAALNAAISKLMGSLGVPDGVSSVKLSGT